MRLSRCKNLFLTAIAITALSLATGCSSEKSTSKQTTHRAVTSSAQSSKKTSNTAKGNTSSKTTAKTNSGKTSAKKTTGKTEKGQASYYADKFHGRATASGEKYDKKKLTGAHRTLPFGTIVRVTNTANGKSVDVRINDRGPFKAGRIVDVSRAAAEKLDMIKAGVINCTMEVISQP